MVKTDVESLSPRAAVIENGPINVLRITAALLVVFGHARVLLLVDYDDAPHNLIQMALYGISSIGHQAVVVFFVLSGYWVGESALRKARNGNFSWPSYLTDRSLRLWVVLVPALVLTLVLDVIGRRFFGSMTTYLGDVRYGGVALDQRPLDAVTFLGNALYMGGIRVPTFGSNTALWSLGYEFWMYIIAPLVLFAVLFRGRRGIVLAVIAFICALIVGPGVLMYVPIWLLGTFVGSHKARFNSIAHQIGPRRLFLARIAAAVLTLGAAVAVRGVNALPLIVGDAIVAIPTAVLLATLTTGFLSTRTDHGIVGWYSRLAGSSYSLYAIHLPILVLGVSLAGVQVDNRLSPELSNWILLTSIVAVVCALGWLFAQGTEKHTDRIRRAVKQRLNIR